MAKFPMVTREEARRQGLVRFYTGAPCRRGHVVERLTRSGICVECNRERALRAMRKIRRLERKRADARELERAIRRAERLGLVRRVDA